MNKLRKPTSDFTIIPNALLRDPTVSFKAKGLYALLFSKPDDWVYIEDALLKECLDGRDSFRSGLKELGEAGWIRKEQVRDKQGNFLHTELWLETEAAKPADGQTVDGFSVDGKSTPTNTDINKTDVTKALRASNDATKAPKRATPRQRLSVHLGANQTCPAEWANEASGIGLSQSDIDGEWPKFVDHHAAKGSVMSDWLAAWRTWCRNALEFAARDRARGARAGQSAGGNLAAALGASVAHRERGERAAGGVGGAEGHLQDRHHPGGADTDPERPVIPF